MSTYVVTLKATGQEVYLYSAESPIEWQGMEFATHDHVALPELPAEPSSPPTMYGGRRDLAVLEFMRLLTATERVTIRMAAAQNALIADYLDLMYHAEVVHLDDPDTSNALHMMEQGGILGAGRAAEILNG